MPQFKLDVQFVLDTALSKHKQYVALAKLKQAEIFLGVIINMNSK